MSTLLPTRKMPISTDSLVATTLLICAVMAGGAYSLVSEFKTATALTYFLVAALGLSMRGTRIHPLAYGFATLVFAVFLLSVNGIMDPAWTTFRLNGLATKQASVHLFIPFAAYGFSWIFEKSGRYLKQISAILIVPITLIAFAVYAFTDQAGSENGAAIINNLYSLEVFRLFFLATICFFALKRPIAIVLILLLSPAAYSTQAQLSIAAMLGLLFFRPHRWLIWVYLGTLIVAVFTSTFFYEALLRIDNNTGVRALFWHNALVALWDTHFAGVGYGTESIVPFFATHGHMRYFVSSIPSQYVNYGVHGSLVQTLFNTGAPGGLLLYGWLFTVLRRLIHNTAHLNRLDYFTIFILFLSISSNMALDSFNFILGSTFLIGYLIYRSNGGEPFREELGSGKLRPQARHRCRA